MQKISKWCSGNVSRIVERIVSKTGENDIILMHDYYDTSVTAALKAIDELVEKGYTFVTVEEILFDWFRETETEKEVLVLGIRKAFIFKCKFWYFLHILLKV